MLTARSPTTPSGRNQFSRSLFVGINSPAFPSPHLRHISFSIPSVDLPMSQFILTITLLHLHHSSFYNPSFASPTSQALHLATDPCFEVGTTILSQNNSADHTLVSFERKRIVSVAYFNTSIGLLTCNFARYWCTTYITP